MKDVLTPGVDSSKLRPKFEVVCSVSADLRDAFKVAQMEIGSTGRTYRDVAVRFILYFIHGSRVTDMHSFIIDSLTSASTLARQS
jgi:hypothetical protein